MLQLVDKEGGPDPAEFRIPASDTKGHSARQWFRCIPTMARRVQEVVQSRAFPYRTKGDIFRHALHRHMRWLNEIEPVQSVTGQVDAILEIMRDEEMNNDFKLVFERLNSRISQYTKEGSQREAVRLLLIIKSHIDSMPDGFWRDKYKERLEESYGDLMRKAPRCRLGEMKDE